MSIITQTFYTAEQHHMPFIEGHATITEAIQSAQIGSSSELVRVVEIGWDGHVIASYRNGVETIQFGNSRAA